MSTITLPNSNELELVIESELHKLPTEATHNHFHNVAENADKIQAQANTVTLVSTVLCGLELEHLQTELKKDNHGCPWKQWVKENCEFSYEIARRYIKTVKCARLGMLDNLDPDLIPNTAPSLMTKEDLKDTSKALADALQGFGSRRQLYLQLDVIKTPQRQTIMENRNTDGSPGSEDIDPVSINRADARESMIPALKPLDEYLKKNHHQHLEPADLKELDDALQAARDLIKPFLNA